MITEPAGEYVGYSVTCHFTHPDESRTYLSTNGKISKDRAERIATTLASIPEMRVMIHTMAESYEHVIGGDA